MAILRKILPRLPVAWMLDTGLDSVYYSGKIRRNYIDQLCSNPRLFVLPKEELEELQYKAIKQAFIHHYNDCKFYHQYCRTYGVRPDDIHGYADIPKIPQIPSETFRQGGITSVPPRKIKNVVTTSGTRSGNPAYTFRDRKSTMRLVEVVGRAILNMILPEALEVSHKGNVNDLLKYCLNNMHVEVFLPPPEESSTWASQLLGILSLLLERILQIPFTWYLKGFEFDEKKILETIKEDLKADRALVYFGFPYVIEKLMRYMDDHDEPGLELDPTGENVCLCFYGGGWKATEPIERRKFQERIRTHFGFNPNFIVEAYAFGESNTLAIDFCKVKNWHILPHVRCVVRDPDTLEPCAPGEKGLMTVYDSSMNCYPAFIITDDFVRVSDIESCECGVVAQNLIKFEERAPNADLEASRALTKSILTEESVDLMEKFKEKAPKTGIGV